MKRDQYEIPLSEIDLSNRIREEFDILELKESIEKFGIIQPISVELMESGKFKLLDGSRRIKACIELKMEKVPTFIFGTGLDNLTQKEVELEANTQKAFTFVERTRLVQQIHDLMIAKHGRKTSTAADAKGWTMDDTAKKLGKSRAYVSNAMEMSEALKFMPELAESKNESEARKVWKQAEKGIKRELILAEARTKSNKTKKDIQKEEIEATYQVGDALELVKEVPDASQHLVEIDWPFAIQLEDHMGEYEDIPQEKYVPFMQAVLKEAGRILHPSGWLFVWYATHPWQEHTFIAIQNLGLRCRRIPLYWEKSQGETRRPEYWLSTNQEQCYYAGGIDARVVRQGRSNRFDQAPVPSQFKIHRTQKPVTLYDDIFGTFVMPGEDREATIMFAGSGNALLSCNNNFWKCRGFDLKEEYKRFFCMNVQLGEPHGYLGWEK